MSLLLKKKAQTRESPGDVSLLSGLTAYFKLEENASPLVDETGTGNGIAYIYDQVPGIKDNALKLNNEFAYANSIELYSLTTPTGIDPVSETPWSFSMWFKAEDLLYNTGLYLTDYINCLGVGYYADGSLVAYNSFFLNGGVDTHNFARTAPGLIIPGQWHNLVFVQMKTISGQNRGQIWLDGIKRSESYAAAGFTYAFGARNLGIGGTVPSPPRDFDALFGTVDEFAEWSRALTRREIGSIWNKGAGRFYDTF